MIKFHGESGKVYSEWNDIQERLRRVEVELFDTKQQPFLVLENYDRYMFQKYGTFLMGASNINNAFRGFQIGGQKDGVGWTILNIDFVSKQISVFTERQITSIAIIEGAVKR